MSDPYDPDWRPRYTGETGLGDVGSCFGADLYQLYRAGRLDLPAAATAYAELAAKLHAIADDLQYLMSTGPAQLAYQRLSEIRGDTQRLLQTTATNLQDVGAALVWVAAAYAETDEVSARELARLVSEDRADFADPLHPVPDLVEATVPATASAAPVHHGWEEAY